MVAITGNVNLDLLGLDSFQEVDITGITMPVTKHNYIVKDVRDLADILREAFQIAQSGRQGPVLVDIPKDITAHTCEFSPQEPLALERSTFPPEEKLQQALGNAPAVQTAFCVLRRRRDLLWGLFGAERVCGKAGCTCGLFPDVSGRIRSEQFPLHGNAGNARYEHICPGHSELRFICGSGNPVLQTGSSAMRDFSPAIARSCRLTLIPRNLIKI